MIVEKELDNKNRISAINSLAVLAFELIFGLIDWTQQEIKSMVRNTRKLLKTFGDTHPKADIDRLYVARKEGGQGPRQVEAAQRNAIVGMAKYVIQQADAPLLKQITLTEAKNEGRGIAKKIASNGLQAVDQEDTDIFKKFHHKTESQKLLKQPWGNEPLHGKY